MILYAYLPDKDGNEPLGTFNKLLRHDLKDEYRFAASARKLLGSGCVVIANSYSFYCRGRDRVIYDGRKS